MEECNIIIEPFAYGLDNSSALSTTTRNVHYFSLSAYGVTMLMAIALLLFMAVLLVRKGHSMVSNKKLLYLLTIFLNIIQVVAIMSGVGHSISKLTNAAEVVGQAFFMIHYETIIITLFLSIICQSMTTKVFYTVYFVGKRRTKLQTFLKHYAIINAIIWTILVSLLVITIFFTLMAYYFPGVNQEIAKDAAVDRFYVDAAVGCFYIISVTVTGSVNIALVVYLIRSIRESAARCGLKPSEEQNTASKKLIAISISQLFLGIGMGLTTFLFILGLLDYIAFAVASHLQRILVFVYSLLVVFTFGPLDDLNKHLSSNSQLKTIASPTSPQRARTKSESPETELKGFDIASPSINHSNVVSSV